MANFKCSIIGWSPQAPYVNNLNDVVEMPFELVDGYFQSTKPINFKVRVYPTRPLDNSETALVYLDMTHAGFFQFVNNNDNHNISPEKYEIVCEVESSGIKVEFKDVYIRLVSNNFKDMLINIKVCVKPQNGFGGIYPQLSKDVKRNTKEWKFVKVIPLDILAKLNINVNSLIELMNDEEL